MRKKEGTFGTIRHTWKGKSCTYAPIIHTHKHAETYRLVLSLSSPPVSSASACQLRLPGFLCGAPEFQMLIHSAGRFAPGPPPPACVGKWNCSGRSTGNILYCCQIPVRQTQVERVGNKGWDLYSMMSGFLCSVRAPLSFLTVFHSNAVIARFFATQGRFNHIK